MQFFSGGKWPIREEADARNWTSRTLTRSTSTANVGTDEDEADVAETVERTWPGEARRKSSLQRSSGQVAGTDRRIHPDEPKPTVAPGRDPILIVVGAAAVALPLLRWFAWSCIGPGPSCSHQFSTAIGAATTVGVTFFLYRDKLVAVRRVDRVRRPRYAGGADAAA